MAKFVGAYLYIIKEREFINARSPVFKVGYSDALTVRIQAYPKGSIVLTEVRVHNGRSTESKLLAALRSRFINRRDIGSEYFEGPLGDIANVFYATCLPLMSDDIEHTVDSVNSTAVRTVVPLEATLKACIDVDNVESKKSRMILSLVSSSVGLQKRDDDLRVFVDAFILEPQNDNLFFRWSSYPGSWNKIANLVAVISALCTCSNSSTFIAAFGKESCSKIRAACSKLQKHFRDNATSFNDERFKKSGAPTLPLPPTTETVTGEDHEEDIEDDEDEELRVGFAKLQTVNADLIHDIQRSQAKLDVCFDMFGPTVLQDPLAMVAKLRELLKI